MRLILGVLSISLMSLYSSKSFAAGGETYFVVTAYYSPLPNQISYTTGSYAGDIRLNGEGHTTASGKGVFPGLLAGPSNYPFGTKIYFEGYGIGVVEDRGGAIVKAGERGHSYDRIDIWMGYGDEGLARAKQWGKRTIKGKIVVPSSEVSISFGESKIGILTKLNVNPENQNIDDVKKVQTIFTKADLYDGSIDGKYESIKNEIIDFQLMSGIISSRDDDAAGWYGPKTISALRQKYGNSNENLVPESKEKFANFNHRVASEKYRIILQYGDLKVDPDSNTDDITSLQELLSELGEYNGKIDGNYKTVESALLDLQKRIGLIENKDTWGAGYFGNRTKSALWTYYEKLDTQTNELSNSDKQKLRTSFERLKNQKTPQYIEILLKQIDTIIPKYQNNPQVLARILYLQEIAE